MNDRDVAEKMAQSAKYENQAKAGYGTTAGVAGCDVQTPMREGMIDGFRSRLARSQRESRKAEQLSELLYLLDKNLEIARILDLVDAVGRDY